MKIKKIGISVLICVAAVALTGCVGANQKKIDQATVVAKIGDKVITKKDLMVYLEISDSMMLPKEEILDKSKTIIYGNAGYEKAMKEGYLEKNKELAKKVDEMRDSSKNGSDILTGTKGMFAEIVDSDKDRKAYKTFKRYRRILKEYNITTEEFFEYLIRIEMGNSYRSYLYKEVSVDKTSESEFKENLRNQLNEEFNIEIFEDEIMKIVQK